MDGKRLHILHVAASLGPESAAGRLCTALRRKGVRISVLSVDGVSFDDGQYFVGSKFIKKNRKRVGRGALKLFHPQRDRSLPWSLSICGYDLWRYIYEIQPDIVHLHWIADSTLDIMQLSKISIPIVWTFHDVWPLTAGCHCDLGCPKWKSRCYQCPQLGAGVAGVDLAAWAWKAKNKAYLGLSQVTAIAPSLWMTSMANQSPLWKGKAVYHIGNALDTEVFSPRDRLMCKRKLGLPEKIPTVLFGATDTSIPYKGFTLLLQTLCKLKGQGLNVHLVIFGYHKPVQQLPCQATYIGKLPNNALPEVYSAADILVAPSLQECFGMVIGEASACETPCVAFDIGGVSDIIQDGYTGFLAQPLNVDHLAQCIKRLLINGELAEQFGKNARKHILDSFDSDLIAKKHIELYEVLLSGKKI